MTTSLTRNPFQGPIPGQSLTKPKGSFPFERPPQYTTEDEALVAVLDQMTQPRKMKMIAAALDSGIYASDITSGILTAGFAQGKWNPDLAAIIAKRVMASVVAVGSAAGVKNIKYKREEKSEFEELKPFLQIKAMNKARSKDLGAQEPDTVPQDDIDAMNGVMAPGAIDLGADEPDMMPDSFYQDPAGPTQPLYGDGDSVPEEDIKDVMRTRQNNKDI